MEELSLHILDLVENSLTAGAKLIKVEIEEDHQKDLLTLKVDDDGRGMSPEMAAKAADPFVTTRTTRRVGLGLSLLKANARACEGDLALSSIQGRSTTVEARLKLSHLDRQPLGDWPRTLTGLILTHPEVDFFYRHRVGGDEFELDTRELKNELGKEALRDPQALKLIQGQVAAALLQLGSAA